MLAIRLPLEIEERLAILAKESGRTKTFYARQAILNYLEDMEDAILGEKRLAEFEASDEKSIPIEDIMREYGLEA